LGIGKRGVDAQRKRWKAPRRRRRGREGWKDGRRGSRGWKREAPGWVVRGLRGEGSLAYSAMKKSDSSPFMVTPSTHVRPMQSSL